MRGRITMAIALVGLAVAGAMGGGYTTDFPIGSCNFDTRGGNLYFSIDPGEYRRLEGVDEDGTYVVVEITVQSAKKTIYFQTPDGQNLSVKTRVIREREWEDDELVEESRNYFARCTRTNDIYYFGEDVDIYENGHIVSHDGAWRAGRDGAQPGLIMPGTFLLGARYFQEMAPEAQDRAKHVKMGLTVETLAGTFEDCVKVVETTPLDPDERSVKIYAPGVGLIVDDFLELVEYQP